MKVTFDESLNGVKKGQALVEEQDLNKGEPSGWLGDSKGFHAPT